jgi:hypothetical protein
MATLANIFDRFTAARADEQACSREQENLFRLRPLANEDVFFYHKRIDNTRVVREADPRAGRVCWRLIGSSIASAVLLSAILVPSLYGLMAGYRIESLRQERQRLETERASLELDEARLLRPERLIELARKQRFVDPEPQKVVYLEGQAEGTLARR